MKKYTKLTLKIYLEHIRKYKIHAFLIFLFVIIGASAGLLPPILYKDFFDILTGEIGSVSEKSGKMIDIIFLILIVHLISWFFWRAAIFITTYFQTNIMRDLSNTCFAYLHKHSFSFFENNFVGAIVKRANRFYKSFETLADIFTFEVSNILVTILFTTIVLTYKNFNLGIFVILWIIIYVSVNIFFNKYKFKYDLLKSEKDSEVTAVLADTVTNNSNVKLFNGYSRERSFFSKITKELKDLRKLSWNLYAFFESIQILFVIFLELIIMYVAVKLWSDGMLTVGDFVLIQGYLFALFGRLWHVDRLFKRVYESFADSEEMAEIFDTPHDIVDNKSAKDLVVSKGKIEFVKTKFNYNKTRNILSNFSLKIKPKEKIALVGPSGAGKSTIIKLLLRMHNITSGKILIDNQRVSNVKQESLRYNISLVPQDPILFHRSLMENIRYGKPDATDEEVLKASKLANCHEFISELQDGYETKVGERGIKLSGGERQRVAIARAILRNAPILVLDEATSSLDSESEKLIQEALSKLMKDKTVIVIAHRLSTIMKMDRIVVIENGQIKEEGPHDKLIKKKSGLYKKLWKVQAGGFLK